MVMLLLLRAGLTAIVLFAGAARASDPPWFTGVGDFPGGDRHSAAHGVSGDGSVVCGYGTAETDVAAFRWTKAHGLQALGDLPGGTAESLAYGVSADGTTIVGQSSSANGIEAFAW